MKRKADEAEKKVAINASLLPNAGIDDYYLFIYPDVPLRCTNGFVGFVGNKSNPDVKIRLEIDLPWMVDHNYASIAFWVNEETYYESRIVMTPRYFEEFRKNPFLKFEVWHEIGHYHTLHCFNTIFNENGSANAARVEYLESGEVMPEEKAADLFGLYYTSREDALKALSYSIERRRAYTWDTQESEEKAVKEFIRRKRILREIDSDEKAREMLCKLCGKDNYLEI